MLILLAISILCVVVLFGWRRFYWRSNHASSSRMDIVPRPLLLPTAALNTVLSTMESVIMIRHGERHDHVCRSWSGTPTMPHTDPPLSHLGRLQALETALYLRHRRLKREEEHSMLFIESDLVCSPFLRCVQTAAIIAVVGFDRKPQEMIRIEPLLGDWLASSIYSKLPRLSGTSRDGAETQWCIRAELIADVVLWVLRELESNQPLLRRFHLKPKMLQRWEALAREPSLLSLLTAKAGIDQGSLLSFRLVPRWTEGEEATTNGHSGILTGYPETGRHLKERVEKLFSTRVQFFVSKETLPARCKDAALCAREDLWITHADVIRVLLELCFSRVQHPYQGISVPYCSITEMCRPDCLHNSNKKKANTNTTTVPVATTVPTHHPLQQPTASLRWELKSVGDLSHLAQSAVKLAFC